MKSLVKVLCAALMVILGCATEPAMSAEPKATDPVGDESNIRNVLKGFAEAWNRHDAQAFSRAFAEDADFTNVRGISAHGRTEIAKFHAPIFADIFKDSSLKIDDVRVRFIKLDVAAVDEWWEMTGARDRNGQEIPLRKGLLTLVMTKQDAQWVISVMHNMDLPVSP
jgi:uncharacterized protein (TIGR02246 family)